MATVGFIGIGVMGAPMSKNIIKGGHKVKAYDINRQSLSKIEPLGAQPMQSPAEAAKETDVVISMLPTGKEVKEAVFGKDGISETISKDSLFIDMSTILPMDTDEIAKKCADLGFGFVDAPVGRLSKNAEAGTLLIMAGGSKENFEKAKPYFENMGNTIFHCGPEGSGSRMKIINNYMSTSLNVLTAETLTMAEKAGLDIDKAIEIMSGTTAGQGHMSTTYQNNVLKGDTNPGFMIDLAHKDMGLALEMASILKSPTPLGAVAKQFYTVAQNEGRGRQDWSSMFLTIKELAREK